MKHIMNWIIPLMLICIGSVVVKANPEPTNRNTGLISYDSPVPTEMMSTLHFCVGQSINLNVVPEGVYPFTYQWYKDGSALTDSTSSTFSIESAALTHSGSYYCLITDANHCTQVSQTLAIDVTDNPTVTIAGDTAAFLGETVILTANGANTYSWANLSVPPSSISPITVNHSVVNVIPAAIGRFGYEVTGTNSLGCSGRDTFSLRVDNCGNTITDIDGNTYSTKAYNHVCWFLENYRGITYSDGVQIPTALVYELPGGTSLPIESIFGRLYDWSSATHANNFTSPAAPPVQGVCPDGWELPSSIDFANLLAVPSVNTTYDLRSVNYWIDHNGTDLVGFNMTPAGYYHHAANRFENMFGETYFITNDCFVNAQSLNIIGYRYNCPDYFFETKSVNDAFSVRCVKRIY